MNSNTQTDWKKIRREYVRGGISYRRLSIKYGVSLSTMRKRALGEGWTALRAKAEAEAKEKISKIAADAKAATAQEIADAGELLLSRITDALCEMDSRTIVVDGALAKQLSGALRDLKELLEGNAKEQGQSVSVEIGEAEEYAK